MGRTEEYAQDKDSFCSSFARRAQEESRGHELDGPRNRTGRVPMAGGESEKPD